MNDKQIIEDLQTELDEANRVISMIDARCQKIDTFAQVGNVKMLGSYHLAKDILKIIWKL